MDHDATTIRQGVRRLRSLLPKAREEVRQGWHWVEMSSAIGAAQAPWLREDNLRAVVVYPAPLGGWHADLILKSVPPGISNVLGTPVQSPCATREDAETTAYGVICMVLAVEARAKGAEAPDPKFLYFGTSITFPAQAFNIALDIMPDWRHGSEAQAIERLDEITSALFRGAEPTYERITALDLLRRAHLQAVCMGALLAGVFRYPPKPHQPPGVDPPMRGAK